jgi:signal transduction histidine kinase
VEDHRRLGADVRRQVFLIYKEALNNVVRHSAATEATIELRVTGQSLALKLSDNGRGFDVKTPAEGQGVTSLKARAHQLGGTLDVRSSPGSGTTLTLIVPLRARLAQTRPTRTGG